MSDIIWIMRAKQRVNNKKNAKYQPAIKCMGAKTVTIKPAGYPLKGMFNEYPEPCELDVFEFYAKEQWNGLIVKKGDFLFDRRMFPDFAFRVIEAEPDNSEIGTNTKFVVEDYEIDLDEDSCYIFPDYLPPQLAGRGT